MASSNKRSTKSDELVRKFTWAISTLNVHFQEIRQYWANVLGISGPQWMILVAVADLDEAEGVPINVVAKTLHVDPSFVTTQSKLLEKRGFLKRKTSLEDARIVQMSLTDKTLKHLTDLAAQQRELNEFIFSELDAGEFAELTSKLLKLTGRFEKASVKIAMDL